MPHPADTCRSWQPNAAITRQSRCRVLPDATATQAQAAAVVSFVSQVDVSPLLGATQDALAKARCMSFPGAPERPCCPVGARSDAADLNALLLGGGESFGSISARTGINKGSLSRHRRQCLGWTPPDEIATPATGDAQPPETAANQAQPAQPLAREPVEQTVDARLLAERIETIAGLISYGGWRDRQTITGFATRWGVSEEEVQRIHRLAAAKCRANRGPISAQTEGSVGVVRGLRDAALQEAKGHDAAVKEALREKDYAAAKVAGRLASMARTSALQAQQHLDKITIERRNQKLLQVNVSVTTDASFAAAWGVVRQVLDARYPGASEVVETALAAWEDHGEDGVTEYLSELAEQGDATLPAVH